MAAEPIARRLISVARLAVVGAGVAGAVVIGRVPRDVEALVELDLDDAAVVALDLDAVGRAVVADLGLQDRPAAGVVERGLGGAVEVVPVSGVSLSLPPLARVMPTPPMAMAAAAMPAAIHFVFRFMGVDSCMWSSTSLTDPR